MLWRRTEAAPGFTIPLTGRESLGKTHWTLVSSSINGVLISASLGCRHGRRQTQPASTQSWAHAGTSWRLFTGGGEQVYGGGSRFTQPRDIGRDG